MTTKAVPSDTAGKLREVISRPGGAMEISRWWSEAQPPGQVEEDCSRPGRDAGPEFATGPIPVRRPFRARGLVVAIPAAIFILHRLQKNRRELSLLTILEDSETIKGLRRN